jgi:hypothetical protein
MHALSKEKMKNTPVLFVYFRDFHVTALYALGTSPLGAEGV